MHSLKTKAQNVDHSVWDREALSQGFPESIILTVDPSTLLTSNESGLQYRLGPNFTLYWSLKFLALFLWLMCSGDQGTIWSVPVSQPSFTWQLLHSPRGSEPQSIA